MGGLLHSPGKHSFAVIPIPNFALLVRLLYTPLVVNTPLPYTELSYPFLILPYTPCYFYTGGTTPLATFTVHSSGKHSFAIHSLLVSYPFLLLPDTQLVNTLCHTVPSNPFLLLAYTPLNTFAWCFDHNLPFNHLLIAASFYINIDKAPSSQHQGSYWSLTLALSVSHFI